jgi:hypothetical protein
LVSVIENFLCDAVGFEPGDKNALNVAVEKTTKKFADIMNSNARNYPGTKFVAIRLIQRPRNRGFKDSLKEIT